MATATIEKKPAKNGQTGGGTPPPEPEHLPCPRCDSTSTKFCYYNNYNYSQPRHYCKACRRYWTHGGTLRDIPVGGGSRKNAKRSRTAISAGSAGFSPVHHDSRHLSSSPILVPMSGGDRGGSTTFLGDGKVAGSFTSLLSNTHGTGLLALGGFGLDDVGFGLGRAVWPFYGVVEGGHGGGDGSGSAAAGYGWQLDNGVGESGFVGVGGGDCFGWPDLAISGTPRTLLK